jgi:ribosomal-protein-alanine N-acetyltransferase
MSLALRYMRFDDIPQVVAIDKQAFSTPWSPRSYAYEIGESTYSHMLVLESSTVHEVQGWKRLVRRFGGAPNTHRVEREVIGYGGLWRIVDEAHVSTIATRPDQRGQGYGELLLAAMIAKAVRLQAGYIVLEVRISNGIAQKLYTKYGFKTEGIKKRYYRDNNEDAYDMRLDLHDDNRRELIDNLTRLLEQHQVRDEYTQEERRPRT